MDIALNKFQEHGTCVYYHLILELDVPFWCCYSDFFLGGGEIPVEESRTGAMHSWIDVISDVRSALEVQYCYSSLLWLVFDTNVSII